MNSIKKVIMATILLGLLTNELYALEVDREVMPRITLGGRVIATVDIVDLDSDPDEDDHINLSDSTLLTRFDKRLYGKGVAGAVVGLKEDESSVAFNQLHAFYWNQDVTALLGRTRLRNTIVEFPLLRDDDLLSYTHVLNASSDEEFDQIYGDLLSVDWIFDRKIQKLGLWGGTQGNGEDSAFANAPNGFDSYGAGYSYEQAEDLIYVKRIRHAGLWVYRQEVETSGNTEWMTALIGGIEFNLNEDPTKNWSAALQVITNDGIESVTSLASVADKALAKSNALVASVRYTGRPHLLTRYQGAITLAYKDYSDFDGATQWSIAPNVVYRIGQGVDLLGQLKYTDYDNGLGGGSDKAIQLGIAFSLETMFNDNIGERDSILNLEHGYID